MRVITYDLSTGNFEYAIPPEEFRDGLLTSMTDYIFPVISPRVTGAAFYLASRAEPDYIKALKLKRDSAKKDDVEVSVTCS